MPTVPQGWTPELLAAYLAGHIDSDGSIGIHTNGTKAKTFRLRVSLYNNCGETLTFLQDAFGGSLHARPIEQHRLAKHVQYTLVWQAKSGYGVLRLVLPYLRTKREQASVALEFYERNLLDGFDGHADRSWQLPYYERMRALNARYNGKEHPRKTLSV